MKKSGENLVQVQTRVHQKVAQEITRYAVAYCVTPAEIMRNCLDEFYDAEAAAGQLLDSPEAVSQFVDADLALERERRIAAVEAINQSFLA